MIVYHIRKEKSSVFFKFLKLFNLCAYNAIAYHKRKEGVSTLKNTTITVGSVTYAMKARRLLLHGGIKARLIKLLLEKTDGGCTHGIIIPTTRFFDAVVILKNANIPYSIYTADSKT